MNRPAKRISVAAIVLAAVLPTAPAHAGPAPANGWPTAGYDAAQSNLNPVEATLNSTSLPSVQHKRTIGLPAPSEECGASEPQPVVSGTTLYTVVGPDLAAYDLTTGTQLWRSEVDPFNTTIYGSLVVKWGRVFVAGHDCISQSDPHGFYSVFNAATGAPIPHPDDLGGATIDFLVASGSRVIVSGHNFADGTTYIAAYASTTLTRVWANDTCAPNPLLVVRGAVIATCPTLGAPKSLAAYSLADGHRLWSKTGNWKVMRGDTDAASATALYAANPAGRLTAVNPSSGAVKWTSAKESGPVLAVGKKRLYVTCDSTALCALNRANGARLWKKPASGSATTSVVVAGDVVYPAPAMRPVLASTGADIVLGIPYWARGSADRVLIASGMIVVTDLSLRTIDIYAV